MDGCTGFFSRRAERCAEYRDNGYPACKEHRDNGYRACDRWDKDCCDWAPCSWACKAFTWVCVAWTWVTNLGCVAWVWIQDVVCTAWVWITTGVCIGIDTIVAVAGAAWHTLESVLGWALSAIGFVIELVLSIPGVGRLIAWALAIVQSLVWSGVGLVDTIAGLIGIRPEKKLRVCAIVLHDENGRPLTSMAGTAITAATMVPWLQRAVEVFRREANVRIIPVAPFHYTTGFDANESVDEGWVHVSDDASRQRILDLGGEAETAAVDLWDVGSDYNKLATMHCFFGTWRRVLGYGAPITVMVIRSLEEGVARSLGPLTDYVVIGGSQNVDTTTLAHEMAHACSLTHSDDTDNLMSRSSPRGTSLTWWQAVSLRGSRHVTYF